MNASGLTSDSFLLLRMIFGHIVADFVLQGESWILDRRGHRWKSRFLYANALLCGLTVYLCSAVWHALWLPFLIAATHVLIDGFKSGKKETTRIFLLDQTLHLSVLLAAWILLSRLEIPAGFAWVASFLSRPAVWIIALSYILVYYPAGIWIRKVLEPWSVHLDRRYRGIEKSGLWIGRLERMLVLTFVLLGRFEVIGFLITAKSILRFGDMKNPDHRRQAEYILIGTMLSMAVALAIGLLAVRFI